MKHYAKYSLFLGAATLGILHSINRTEFAHAKESHLLRHDAFYDWRFGRIAYTKLGKGQPILLLHDWECGSSAYEYHRLAYALSSKFQVYTLDFLGYGLSDKPEITYTGYLQSQLITDFIKHIIKKKTHIISSGHACHSAILACHNEKAYVGNIIAINPKSLFALSSIPSKRSNFLKFLLSIPVIGTFLYNLWSNEKSLEKKFREEYFSNPYAIKKRYIHAYREAAHMVDYKCKYSFSSLAARYTNLNIVHCLKEIDHSLYIIGGKGVEGMEDTIENYLYYNNAIEYVWISGAKSLPHLEKPKEVLQHIRTLLHQ